MPNLNIDKKGGVPHQIKKLQKGKKTTDFTQWNKEFVLKDNNWQLKLQNESR